MTRPSMYVAVAALALAACGDNGFDPPSLILGPRLLAIVAEPPETGPGRDVTVEAFTALGEDLQFEWTVDLSPAALARGAGQAIGEEAPPLALRADGARAVLPAADIDRAIAALVALVGGAATGTVEAVVRQVYEQVGLPIRIDLVVRDGEGTVLVEGFKRVMLTARATLTTNPPPPDVTIAGVRVRGAPGAFDCAPDEGPPRARPGEIVTLAPAVDEAWLEPYPALDLEGRVVTGQENAYYSWFSTAGDFDFAVTRAPEREALWTAPTEPGLVPLFIVVRDGHLGASACRAEILVE